MRCSYRSSVDLDSAPFGATYDPERASSMNRSASVWSLSDPEPIPDSSANLGDPDGLRSAKGSN